MVKDDPLVSRPQGEFGTRVVARLGLARRVSDLPTIHAHSRTQI